MLWWWLAQLGCAFGVADPCAPSGDPPGTVGDVLDHLAALPMPLSIGCFASSLPRPLPLEASEDVFSAQPAVGLESPRLLVWYPGLTLTFGLSGPGASLVEMGEVVEIDAAELTIKAELAFPVEAPLSDEAPYERILAEDGSSTKCIGCHGAETEVAPGEFASVPFRPDPLRTVAFDTLEDLAKDCPRDALDERCVLLRAIFDHGDVEHVPLPGYWPTLYQP